MLPKQIFFLFLMCFCVLLPNLLCGQEGFEVRFIKVEGLNKCKPQVVFRELPFREASVLQQDALMAALEEGKNRLMNTGLFSTVNVVLDQIDTDNQVDIRVEVVEAWYPYLIPVFELADRNFNVWFVEYERDFQRTNYGLHFYHFNISGRGDRFELLGQQGFTHKYETEYYAPFLSSKRKKTGLFVNLLYTNNRDLNFATANNQQVFYRDPDQFLFSRRRFILGLEHRNSIYLTQGLSLGGYKYIIDEYVESDLNSDFLLGQQQQRFFSLEYTVLWDKRDERPYPMDGIYSRSVLRKEGLGLFRESNNLFLSTDFRYYKQFTERFSISSRTYFKVGLLRNQLNFFQKRILGYDDQYIRGYEYYVIDGLDAILVKNDLRFKVFDRTINWGRLVWLDAYKKMATQVFLAPFVDLGIANDPWAPQSNDFNGRLLPGYGLGLNFRFYYDKVFRVEWSRNVLGEAGIYLHWDLRV